MGGQRWLTVVLLLAATAAPAGAAEAKRTCLPLGGLLVPDTIRARTADRLEVTEPLGEHRYRVTRCTLEGVLTRSMLVAPVADPDEQLVLAPGTIVEPRQIRTIDYGD